MPKEAKVFISPEARADLVSIFEYILAQDGLEPAEKCVEELESAISSLRTLAKRGKYPPELLAQGSTIFREVQCYPWRIFYRNFSSHQENTVWVLAVLDGRRNIASVLPERLARI